MIDDSVSEESLQELHVIEQRQQALQQMIKIAQLAEQLNQSLNSVVILGKSIKKVPEKLLAAFSRLQKKTSQYSDSEISRKVHVLESKIKQKISAVIRAAEQPAMANTVNPSEMESFNDNFTKLIQDFKEDVQNSVALRITLQQRGAPLKPLITSVSLPVLQKKVSSLRQTSKQYRKIVVEELKSVEETLDTMLKSSQYPGNVQKMLKKAIADIKIEQEYLESGKSIDQIPIAINTINIDAVHEEAKPVRKKSTPQKQAQETHTIINNVEHEIKPSQQTTPNPPATGFFKRVIIWLTTPWGTSWDDLKQQPKNPKHRN